MFAPSGEFGEVRLEQNYIDPAAFARILDAKFDSKICCDARSKWSDSQRGNMLTGVRP